MATFVANKQFSIDNLNLGFEVSGAVIQHVPTGASFEGTSYPTYYSVTATSGSASRKFEIFGNFTVEQLFGYTVPKAGTINAVAEYDASSGTYAWFATGLSTDVAAGRAALLSSSTADDIALIAAGLAGDDTITLSPFDDVMRGYGGHDRMKGGGGNDILDGGAGNDTAVFDTSFANATITFEGNVLVISTPTEGTDRLSNFEFVDFAGDVRAVASLLPPNDPPVPTAATASATEDGAVVNGQLAATDPQGDSLTFSQIGASVPGLTINANGTYSFNPSAMAYQSLAAGQTQQVVANFSVSDGRATANSTLTITVTGVNDAPTFSQETRTLTTAAGAAVQFAVTAVDVDGDTLTYSPSNPAHGTVTNSGGTYTYTPAAGYSGTDTFTVQASDGKGGTATQSFTVTVTAPNVAPVITTQDLTISTDVNTAAVFTVTATDANGDALTYSAPTPAHGTIIVGANGKFTYTPTNGFTGTDTVVVTVSDGKGGTDTETFTITVGTINENTPPEISTDGIFVFTRPGTAKAFTVTATDDDGDTLTYSASNPAHGSITGGANGQFTYTPTAGFIGTDTVTVTVSDGNGGTDTQVYTFRVGELIPTVNEFALLASSGFSGSIGGYGNVFGSATGAEMITVIDVPGAVRFDPSFNKGNDAIHLSGDAADWTIVRAGSAAILSDGDTFVEIPVGVAGLAIAFDDGIRTLRIDTAAATLRIGNQAFAENPVTITAPAQNVEMPHEEHGDASAQLVLQSGGEVVAGGVLKIFGTATGDETLKLLYGNVSFDPSFNRGDDTLVLDAAATTFTAARAGSNLTLSSDGISVEIPVGIKGMTIEFAGGDERVLRFDTGVASFVLGDQQIGFDPVALAAA